jgi:hypothetical protein
MEEGSFDDALVDWFSVGMSVLIEAKAIRARYTRPECAESEKLGVSSTISVS